MLTERRMGAGDAGALSTQWRQQIARAQEDALPSGSFVVSCPAPLGVGGLGRHAEEILDALARREAPAVGILEPPGRQPREGARAVVEASLLALGSRSPAWRMWGACVQFDRHAARRLVPADHVIAFNGSAAEQFARARESGRCTLGLVSATSHVSNVVRQHARAHRQYPLEGSWATRLRRRTLSEYSLADRIYVSSQRSWASFVQEGVSPDALARFPLTPNPRFARGPTSERSSTFDIVYSGSLSVVKGVPLLIDAVSRLAHADLRLILVGGWGTRGMRRFIQAASARDPRIETRRGDPLPVLQRARLYVHPSYDDGFAYSPAEALATGLPVIVTEGTGMKDLIEPGRNGVIVASGDVDELAEAIDAAYRGGLLGG